MHGPVFVQNTVEESSTGLKLPVKSFKCKQMVSANSYELSWTFPVRFAMHELSP